jgi:hypothetical protein
VATICVVANSNNKNLKTVNVVAGTAPKGGKGHNQVPAAQNTLKQFKNYQPTASSVAGLPTIYIPGFSGPA